MSDLDDLLDLVDEQAAEVERLRANHATLAALRADLPDHIEWAAFSAQYDEMKAEIERLRGELDALTAEHASLSDWSTLRDLDMGTLTARLDAVRALHVPVVHCPDDRHDAALCPCGVTLCASCGHHTPCPTIRALDPTPTTNEEGASR